MAALGPFERQPGIAVGVSGGADSTALALLLQAWVRARGGRLLALVVDHRLRPDSTAEAAAVQARLAALGIAAQVLTRPGAVPATALQATAREARYALLERAAAAAGFLHLAIAQHRRDQQETAALRRAAGSGPRGLAGMPAVRELERVRLIRPVLGIAPERLQALLAARGVPWLDDPSNRDPRFWRARFRAAARPAAADDAAGLAAAAACRRALDDRVAAWLARHASPQPLGFVTVPLAVLEAAADELLAAVLARLVTATAGAVWPPAPAKLGRLCGWLRGSEGRRLALGGVLVERAGQGTVRFVREPRAVAGPAPIGPGGLLWDRRFRVDWPGAPGGATVAAAGPGWRRRLDALPDLRAGGPDPAGLPAIVLETLPLVSRDGHAVALGPWRLAGEAGALAIRFRPHSRYADIPFGPTLAVSVA